MFWSITTNWANLFTFLLSLKLSFLHSWTSLVTNVYFILGNILKRKNLYGRYHFVHEQEAFGVWLWYFLCVEIFHLGCIITQALGLLYNTSDLLIMYSLGSHYLSVSIYNDLIPDMLSWDPGLIFIRLTHQLYLIVEPFRGSHTEIFFLEFFHEADGWYLEFLLILGSCPVDVIH